MLCLFPLNEINQFYVGYNATTISWNILLCMSSIGVFTLEDGQII